MGLELSRKTADNYEITEAMQITLNDRTLVEE